MHLDDISELEQYRLEALTELKQALPKIKKIAEETLSCKVHKVAPIGPITDPAKFTENSDVDVAVYTRPNSSLIDEAGSDQLQAELIKHPFGSFGVVNCIVFS